MIKVILHKKKVCHQSVRYDSVPGCAVKSIYVAKEDLQRLESDLGIMGGYPESINLTITEAK